VRLEDQDWSRSDRLEIDEGVSLLEAAMGRGRPGPYEPRAAIAACHATAAEAAAPDWAQIARLHGMLAELAPSPVIKLSPAVAAADGPAAGLELIAGLEASGALRGYHLPPATRAGLIRRLGHTTKAAASYREALELAATDAEHRSRATPKAPKPGHRQTRSPQPPLRRKINPLQMLTPFTWRCILMM
jgi:RNA polymerase sigma-70 factor (ECF subfamily)